MVNLNKSHRLSTQNIAGFTQFGKRKVQKGCRKELKMAFNLFRQLFDRV